MVLFDGLRMRSMVGKPARKRKSKKRVSMASARHPAKTSARQSKAGPELLPLRDDYGRILVQMKGSIPSDVEI